MKHRKLPLEWPYPTSHVFEVKSRRMHRKMLDYLILGRGARRFRASVVIDSLKHHSAIRGLASSPEVRIALVQALLPKVLDVFSRQSGAKLFLVTVAPKMFASDAKPDDVADLGALRSLVEACLSGHDFIAAIEPALYDNPSFRYGAPMPKHRVSWHVHAIVSAGAGQGLRAQIEDVLGEQNESLVPGWPACHVKEMEASTLEPRLLYILKLPRRGVRVFEGKSSSPESPKSARYHQKKREIAPKELHMLLAMLAPYKIGALVFGGGIGGELVRQAFRRALVAIKRNEVMHH